MSWLAKSDSISELALSKISVSNPRLDNCERMLTALAFATKRSCLPSIPGAGQMSMSRSMVCIFTFLNSSKTPSCSFLETSAITFSSSLDNSPSAIPKLPDVASITVCPLLSFPVTMASWIMLAAGLTLIEPVSKAESNLPRTFRSASSRFIL